MHGLAWLDQEYALQRQDRGSVDHNVNEDWTDDTAEEMMAMYLQVAGAAAKAHDAPHPAHS
jgi:hypothetical protein